MFNSADGEYTHTHTHYIYIYIYIYILMPVFWKPYVIVTGL